MMGTASRGGAFPSQEDPGIPRSRDVHVISSMENYF